MSGFSRTQPSIILNGPEVGISLHAARQQSDWPHKQLSVTLNFTNEKSPSAMWPLIKIL